MQYILTKAFFLKLSITGKEIDTDLGLLQGQNTVLTNGRGIHFKAMSMPILPNIIRFLEEKVYFCYPKRRHGKHSSHI